MSEEPEVSPLRLKRPGAGAPPPAADAAPAAPSLPPLTVPDAKLFEPPLIPLPGMPALPVLPPVDLPPEGGHGERLRRRPSLAPEGGAAPGISAPHPHAEHPGATVPPLFAPPSETPPPPAAPAFKLKIGAKLPPPPVPPPGAEIGAPDPLKAFEESAGGAPLLPLPGVGPGASMGATVPPLMPLPTSVGGLVLPPSAEPTGQRTPIHLRASGPAEALDPSKLAPPPLPARAAKAAVNRSHAKRDALVFGLVLLLVVGAGAGAYFYFSGSEPAPEPAPPPAKAIAEVREKEQARVNAVVDGKEPPAERVIGNVTPGELQTKLQEKNSAVPVVTPAENPPPATTAGSTPVATTEPAPPPVPEGPPPIPKANPRFVRYAESIRVSGVYQGSPARALIDGRLVREGEVVEPALGIKFSDIDAEAKQIILEDGSGAQVKVKYL